MFRPVKILSIILTVVILAITFILLERSSMAVGIAGRKDPGVAAPEARPKIVLVFDDLGECSQGIIDVDNDQSSGEYQVAQGRDNSLENPYFETHNDGSIENHHHSL